MSIHISQCPNDLGDVYEAVDSHGRLWGYMWLPYGQWRWRVHVVARYLRREQNGETTIWCTQERHWRRRAALKLLKRRANEAQLTYAADRAGLTTYRGDREDRHTGWRSPR